MAEEVTIEGTQVHHLQSDDIGQDFLLNVSVPPSYKTTLNPYPVVYVTDGGPGFIAINSVVPLMQLTGELTPFITVGITYDVDNSGDIMTLRTKDLTHCDGDMGAVPEDTPDWMKKLPPSESGGSANFLNFINSKIKPLI